MLQFIILIWSTNKLHHNCLKLAYDHHQFLLFDEFECVHQLLVLFFNARSQ